jgi:L-lactate utilization protein LutB
MQDPAAFFRQRAGACFHRLRKYPVNSEDWRHCVKEARQFIRAYRLQIEARGLSGSNSAMSHKG